MYPFSVMEVENHDLKETHLGGSHFPLPWLWEDEIFHGTGRKGSKPASQKTKLKGTRFHALTGEVSFSKGVPPLLQCLSCDDYCFLSCALTGPFLWPLHFLSCAVPFTIPFPLRFPFQFLSCGHYGLCPEPIMVSFSVDYGSFTKPVRPSLPAVFVDETANTYETV